MDNYLIEETYWIWLVIFSIIIIPLQDLSKALFCIPSIIKDYNYHKIVGAFCQPTITTGLFWLTLDGKNVDALYNITFTYEDTYNQKREAF